MDFMRLSEVFARISEIQQRFQFDFGVSAEPFKNALNDAMAKGNTVLGGTEALNAVSKIPAALTGQNNALTPLEAQEKVLKSKEIE